MPETWIKKIGLGVAAVAIVAAVGAGISEGLREAAKSLTSRGIGFVQSWYEDRFPSAIPKADNKAALSILVARLYGDEDGSQTRHVVASLRRALDLTDPNFRIQVIAISRTLKKEDSGDVFLVDQGTAKRGQEWLKESGARMLIWGQVADRNRVLRIFFLSDDSKAQNKPSESYKLTETLELEKNFDHDLGFAIAAWATTLATNAMDESKFVAAVLEQIYPRLKTIVRQGPVAQSKATCQVQSTLGNVARVLGEQKGDNARLAEAIETQRAVINNSHCADDKAFVTRARHRLGLALWGLGERGSTARLEEAINEFRELLTEWTRESSPLNWAMTQVNLGGALQTLDSYESGTTRLEEAVVAYREALKEYTRERTPGPWATVQSNLGYALTTLDEVGDGTVRLKEAVIALREALKERPRERVPLDWAMTQTNLGNALRIIGERESVDVHLEEAVAAYGEALKEYTRERTSFQWAIPTGNQGVALMRLAERRSDARMAQTAAAQIDAALAVMREVGHTKLSSDYERRLEEARALLDRLRTP